MRKSGGAAIPMKELDLSYLSGGPIERLAPRMPFDDNVCAFLEDLSREIKKDPRIRRYPDVASFAFYCRRANIARLKGTYQDGQLRMGRGFVFHIAPSNVPVNFAFTYLFGLLAGNANVVRVSAKPFEQVDIICDAMNRLFAQGAYQRICEQTAIVRYERKKEITNRLSELADIRVLWGGDKTIEELRQSPMKPRCTEITFADRYSFALFDVQAVLDANDETIGQLADSFYNDTYLMDQNACSTPHMIFWKSTGEASDFEKAQGRFWQAVHAASSQKYDLADIKVIDKYTSLCKMGVDYPGLFRVTRYGNYLYVLTCNRMLEDLCALRGKYGMFFQREVSDIEAICPLIHDKVQTCAVFGIDEKEVRNLIIENGLTGIDRVVPVGKTLDIGIIWDGYDLIRQLSRVLG